MYHNSRYSTINEMKIYPICTVLALSSSVRGHYLFGRLILNGKWTKTWEYVREIEPRADSTPELASVYPLTDPDSVDLRCGRNASDFQGIVKTATVQAGDLVGIAAGESMLQGDVRPWMYHPGFASAWLSKAPSDNLGAYTGDGDWFKILSVTNRTEQSLNFSDPWAAKYYDQFKAIWGTYRLDSYNFTIPKATPPGKYLLSAGIGAPAPMVKIPGIYKRDQSDVYFDVYNYALTHNYSVNDFIPPAPVVWAG
ncbi:lytic polysaccharide monooxygenase [Xylaria telfairii]|nr:lytic polysaccharide monooxygenase [Xylaria telfairii]